MHSQVEEANIAAVANGYILPFLFVEYVHQNLPGNRTEVTQRQPYGREWGEVWLAIRVSCLAAIEMSPGAWASTSLAS